MSDALQASAKLHVERPTSGYWRAILHNPPINLLDGDLLLDLCDLLDQAEADSELRVIVFESADPDFFIAHLDVHGFLSPPPGKAPVKLGEIWPAFIARFARSSIISIAKVRGRARGVGSEFALACDMRFASREKAIFAQPEVGFGAFPGGGGVDWLSRVVGRPRALEIMLGCADYDADMAERYGWINRALPDDRLDAWVDDMARRIASFDRATLSATKRHVNARSAVPTEAELVESYAESGKLAVSPEGRARLEALVAKGWGGPGETELWLADFLSPRGAEMSVRSGR
ncbi:short chain enoyl-CoA hydratase [Caballeronia sordidicola]|uniref:Short chain enoyl-CoA hydratase n=1 Tax=Caballeronia sordidicola TaxID=196367 RepID=A0A158ERJ6_CABSO|nr:enoyl-CoA hydratase/isomerase family protein [Caballeronia sordidicola]SAL09709.1 short chain enoyl-CoA hydratase [Caballeronia sordidicola]